MRPIPSLYIKITEDSFIELGENINPYKQYEIKIIPMNKAGLGKQLKFTISTKPAGIQNRFDFFNDSLYKINLYFF